MDPTGTACCPLANTAKSETEQTPEVSSISMLPWHHPNLMEVLRHLRLDLYLPDPYSKNIWNNLTQQLVRLQAMISKKTKLKDLKILIATWHRFRELSDWQCEAVGLLGQLSIRGSTEVRTRSLDERLRDAFRVLGLTSKLQIRSATCTPDASTVYCVDGGDLDWDWEGGITI